MLSFMFLIMWDDPHNEEHRCSWQAGSLGEIPSLFQVRPCHLCHEATRRSGNTQRQPAAQEKRKAFPVIHLSFEVIKAAWGLKIQLGWSQCWAVSLPWPQWSLDLALEGRNCAVSTADVVEDWGMGVVGYLSVGLKLVVLTGDCSQDAG